MGLLDNLYFDINGLSRHVGDAKTLDTGFKYNEKNPGFGFTAENVNDRGLIKMLTAGGYKNSYGKNSYYGGAGLGKRFGKNYYLDLGGFGGLTSGYSDIKQQYMGNDGLMKEYTSPYDKINPMAGVYMNLGKKDTGRLGLKFMPGKPSILMLNYGVQFK